MIIEHLKSSTLNHQSSASVETTPPPPPLSDLAESIPYYHVPPPQARHQTLVPSVKSVSDSSPASLHSTTWEAVQTFRMQPSQSTFLHGMPLNNWRQITNENTQAMVGPSPEGYEEDAENRVHQEVCVAWAKNRLGCKWPRQQ